MRKRLIVFPAIIALLFFGCATLSNTASWNTKSPKEKSLYFIKTYNQQYDDTMFMAKSPNLTEAQKQVVRTKKKILTNAWPAIHLYDSIAANGGVPSPEQEQVILNFINQLVSMTI